MTLAPWSTLSAVGRLTPRLDAQTCFAKLFADIGTQEDVRRADLQALLASGAPPPTHVTARHVQALRFDLRAETLSHAAGLGSLLLGLVVDEELCIVDCFGQGPVPVPELREVQASGSKNQPRVPDGMIAIRVACVKRSTGRGARLRPREEPDGHRVGIILSSRQDAVYKGFLVSSALVGIICRSQLPVRKTKAK